MELLLRPYVLDVTSLGGKQITYRVTDMRNWSVMIV